MIGEYIAIIVVKVTHGTVFLKILAPELTRLRREEDEEILGTRKIAEKDLEESEEPLNEGDVMHDEAGGVIIARRTDEKIVIDERVTVMVVRISGSGKVRLGIEAPLEVTVHRLEVFRSIVEGN